MRLLLDENVPAASVRRLREAGHDVEQVARGASDPAALERAASAGRLLVTYDRDFGFLVFRVGSHVPPGVIYFREPPRDPLATAEALISLAGRSDVVLEGRFTVIGADRIRQRRLPGAS